MRQDIRPGKLYHAGRRGFNHNLKCYPLRTIPPFTCRYWVTYLRPPNARREPVSCLTSSPLLDEPTSTPRSWLTVRPTQIPILDLEIPVPCRSGSLSRLLVCEASRRSSELGYIHLFRRITAYTHRHHTRYLSSIVCTRL